MGFLKLLNHTNFNAIQIFIFVSNILVEQRKNDIKSFYSLYWSISTFYVSFMWFGNFVKLWFFGVGFVNFNYIYIDTFLRTRINNLETKIKVFGLI